MFMSSKHIKIMIIEIIIKFINYINLVYFLREDSLSSSTRRLEEIRLKITDLDHWKSKSNLVERLLSMLEVIVTEMFFPPGTEISCKEKIRKENIKCVYLFLFIITKSESLLLFKLY